MQEVIAFGRKERAVTHHWGWVYGEEKSWIKGDVRKIDTLRRPSLMADTVEAIVTAERVRRNSLRLGSVDEGAESAGEEIFEPRHSSATASRSSRPLATRAAEMLRPADGNPFSKSRRRSRTLERRVRASAAISMRIEIR